MLVTSLVPVFLVLAHGIPSCAAAVTHVANRPSRHCSNNTLPSQYTITAYKKDDATINGLKVQGGGAFIIGQANVSSYCPSVVQESGGCPNGTQTALAGSLYPLSLVPGGQELYVDVNGAVRITVQHSHSIPPGAYPYYLGWTWTPFSSCASPCSRECPRDDPRYDCGAPEGYWTFKSPDEDVGGLYACPAEYNANATQLFARTPAFNQTGCAALDGLATHNYTGPSPPVWAY
ncbi:hypothetical protein H2203_000976 [Taxawa tesnikishii (nom. ined.)]|nr:hypothetical protein H2203_000976 [Dothideales sp. JES 119]